MRTHLQRKLDYMEGNASVKTAEGFIYLAANKSSATVPRLKSNRLEINQV
jgi:hypothetical protein